jgi:uncharacterized membrane protein
MNSLIPQSHRWATIVLVLAAAVLFIAWLTLTPPGLLGKADAIGYSVCHRIASRSYFLGSRQLPLCARCSGMYLGALLGMIFFFARGRRSGLPARKYLIIFAALAGLFAVDGLNSYLHFFPGAPWLYQPENWLRLATGLGLGIGISAILVPVLNLTFFTAVSNLPVLNTWKEFFILAGAAALTGLAVASELPLLLYPLALLSAFSTLLLLTFLYAALWVIVTHRENRYTGWRQTWIVLVAGFSTAMLQIAGIDLLRYLLTHTWNGFGL